MPDSEICNTVNVFYILLSVNMFLPKYCNKANPVNCIPENSLNHAGQEEMSGMKTAN